MTNVLSERTVAPVTAARQPPPEGPSGRRRPSLMWALLIGSTLLSILAGLLLGGVSVSLSDLVAVLIGGEPDSPTATTIVREIRLPRVLTAATAGAALGLAGLQMQTLFRNALADAYVLGVSAGASLGVGIVLLSAGASTGGLLAGVGVFRQLSVAGGATAGAALVMGLMMFISIRVSSTVVVLIVGVMVAAFVGAFTSILIWFSTPESIRDFTTWGFGTFAGVGAEQLRILIPAVVATTVLGLATTKQLNGMLLGERYATSMGVSTRRTKILILASASLSAGVITAYCGPIAFIGIAIPHLARSVLRTSDHRQLVPASILLGVTMAVACSIVAEMPGASTQLPLNAATALLGAPVVGAVLLRTARSNAQAWT